PYLVAERGDELGVLEAQLGVMARNVAATIAELRVEHERLQSILRSMVEGVLVTDLSGGVVLMNERARELFELPRGLESSGRRLIELVRDPQVADLTRELASGVPLASRDLTLAGGQTLHVNAAPLRDADGRPFGFVLVLHDVTELRRLEVVRRDFVANVMTYSSAGGRIAISAGMGNGAHADMVEIAVEDTGTGIPAEDLPRLTERFFRVEKARSRALGGTGLGLAIVKHIVQAHDGALGIDSTLGRGTTVRVLLPSAGTAEAGSMTSRPPL